MNLIEVGHSDILAATETYTAKVKTTVPNVAAGSYFLLVKTDRNNYVFESNENNNIQSLAITVNTPDLVPTVLTAPTTVTTEQQIEVTWTVTNQGTGSALPDWRDSLYLSSNNVLDSGDTELTYPTHYDTLAAADSYTTSAKITIPSVTAGSYYLLIKTDRDGSVYESNENNNVKALAITINTPDLVPTVLTAPITVNTEQQIDVTWTVKNQGTGNALPDWRDFIYLSTNSVLDSGDTELVYPTHSEALAAAESYTATAKITMPNVTAGSYSIPKIAD